MPSNRAGGTFLQPFRELAKFLLSHRPEAMAAKPMVIDALLFYEAFDPPFPPYELRRAESEGGMIALALEGGIDSVEHRTTRRFIEVATTDAAIEADLASVGGEQIAEFAHPPTLRSLLLSNPVVTSLLSWGRDSYRTAALRVTGAPLRSYRVPADRFTIDGPRRG